MRVKMLGNAWDYENGREYDLPDEEALALIGMGYAAAAPAANDEEE